MADCRIKNEMDCKNVLQLKFRILRTAKNYEKYKGQRNKVNHNLIKRAKQNYKKTCWMKTSKTLLHSGKH